MECLEPGDLKHTLAEAKKTRNFLQELTGQKVSSSRRASTSVSQLTAGVAVTDITPPSNLTNLTHLNLLYQRYRDGQTTTSLSDITALVCSQRKDAANKDDFIRRAHKSIAWGQVVSEESVGW